MKKKILLGMALLTMALSVFAFGGCKEEEEENACCKVSYQNGETYVQDCCVEVESCCR
jgi:hypothetical protein